MKQNDYTTQPIRASGVSVEVGHNFERSLKQFIKKTQEAGIIKRCKETEFFESPSEKKQRDRKAAKARWEKKRKSLDPRFKK